MFILNEDIKKNFESHLWLVLNFGLEKFSQNFFFNFLTEMFMKEKIKKISGKRFLKLRISEKSRLFFFYWIDQNPLTWTIFNRGKFFRFFFSTYFSWKFPFSKFFSDFFSWRKIFQSLLKKEFPILSKIFKSSLKIVEMIFNHSCVVFYPIFPSKHLEQGLNFQKTS